MWCSANEQSKLLFNKIKLLKKEDNTMDKGNYLDSIKQIFKGIHPTNDKRAEIQALDFITALIFSFTGDSKIYSLEAIRRKMKDLLKKTFRKALFGIVFQLRPLV